jgi:hypothetical protein
MERLPNELWLSIFSYLSAYDLLTIFSNLNRRFHQLVLITWSESESLDFSYLTYKEFNFLYSQRLTQEQQHPLYSLTLRTRQQLEVFAQRIDWRIDLMYLKSLTLVSLDDDWEGSNQLVQCYIKNLAKLKNLATLRLFGESPSQDRILQELATQKLDRLTSLTLSFLHTFKHDFVLPPIQTSLLTSIKRLTTRVHEAKQFIQLLTLLPNVIEVNIYIDYFPHLKSCSPKYAAACEHKSLRQLQLEFGFLDERDQLRYKELKRFLYQFRELLVSLKLIFTTTDINLIDSVYLRELADSGCFPHLKSYHYLIHTSACPTRTAESDIVEQFPDNSYSLTVRSSHITTSPQSAGIRLNSMLHKYWSISDYSLPYLTTVTLWKYGLADFLTTSIQPFLPRLRKICFSGDNGSSIHLFRKPLESLFKISPNLNILELTMENSHEIIEFLKQMPIIFLKRNTIQLDCKTTITNFHLTFLLELSFFFKHLNQLNLTFDYDNYQYNLTRELCNLHDKNQLENVLTVWLRTMSTTNASIYDYRLDFRIWNRLSIWF